MDVKEKKELLHGRLNVDSVQIIKRRHAGFRRSIIQDNTATAPTPSKDDAAWVTVKALNSILFHKDKGRTPKTVARDHRI